jgi:microcystin-dependent protein
MNRINFTAKDNFPLSSDTMELLQQIIATNAGLAALCGSNYILSGCVENGTDVSAGIVVIDGEILPFQAGTKQSKITIEETTQDLTAFGVNYPESYIFRVAKFSATGAYNWSDFSQVVTNKELDERVSNIKGDAIGIIKLWAGTIGNVPDGYRLCNGDSVSTDPTSPNYLPELFAVLGTRFGGNGSPDFNLPDLRGRFVVGYDSSDNDYNDINSTKIGGAKTVTLTESQIPAHTHTTTFKQNGVDDTTTPNFNAVTLTSGPGNDYSAESGSKGGGQDHENRPPYFTLAYIIKVK